MDQDDHSELFTGLAVCGARFVFLFFPVYFSLPFTIMMSTAETC